MVSQNRYCDMLTLSVDARTTGTSIMIMIFGLDIIGSLGPKAEAMHDIHEHRKDNLEGVRLAFTNAPRPMATVPISSMGRDLIDDL